MSLSKEKPIEDNYRRYSFDDRVCDDLCEVILQFLSLEDKLRLECVSKQFQRTVFCSQRKLTIDLNKSDNSWKRDVGKLLEKLPALTSVQFSVRGFRQSKFERKINEAMELIVKYCHNLNEFDFYLICFVVKDIQQKFFEKFGSKLVSVGLNTHFNRGFTQIPNTEELSIRFDNYNKIPEIEFKGLKKFICYDLRLDLDLNSFKAFIERNAKTITHLSINCVSRSENSKDVFKLLLTIVSNVKNLIHLRISSDFAINDNSFTAQLTQIAVNCNQLKSLEIDYEFELNNGPNADHFSALRQFKRLKRLEICFVNESNELSDYESNNDFFPFKDLKSFPELTHIWFIIIDHDNLFLQELTEHIFTDIDIDLPKLQSLYIKGMAINFSEKTVVMMSRLTRLESIELWLTKEDRITQITSQLNNNCKKVRKIRFY